MNERDKELTKQVKWTVDVTYAELEEFAALIRADEREACAKVCDDAVGTWNGWPQAKSALTAGAMAIRARGNA